MPNTQKMLTVETLIAELQKHPLTAEVAVAMISVNITIPIGFITTADCDNNKQFTLMMVSAEACKRGIEYAERSKAEERKKVN
ncbi:MAG: hypothetical protein ABIP54_02290 [Candidatus Andersenbacteria bacterium]